MNDKAAELSQDFLNLINKKKPKRKDTVVALYKVTQVLEDVASLVREVHESNQTLTKQFYEHVTKDQERVNKEKGAWKVFVWAIGIIQAIVFAAMTLFWSDYVNKSDRIVELEKNQAAHMAAYPIKKR